MNTSDRKFTDFDEYIQGFPQRFRKSWNNSGKPFMSMPRKRVSDQLRDAHL